MEGQKCHEDNTGSKRGLHKDQRKITWLNWPSGTPLWS